MFEAQPKCIIRILDLMSILIVNDETHTRGALRNLLHAIGHQAIVEAKSKEEALKVIKLEKSRIRMIIVDAELSDGTGENLAQEIEPIHDLVLAPFILLSSRSCSHSRVDYCLAKPFGKTGLIQGIRQAHKKRVSLRNQILYIGKNNPTVLESLLSSSHTGFWKGFQQICTPLDLRKLLPTFPIHFGAVLLDPICFTEMERAELHKSLASFKKNRLGTTIPLTCLSRTPSESYHFRTLCQFFELQTTVQDWQSILWKSATRNLIQFEMDLDFRKVRHYISQGKISAAWKLTQSMLKLDPGNCQTYSLAGDLEELRGHSQNAVSCYLQALALNPNLPRPYLKIFSQLNRKKHELLIKKLESAVQFCPRNIAVLLASAKVYSDLGDLPRAINILEEILKIRKNLCEAKDLYSKIQRQQTWSLSG